MPVRNGGHQIEVALQSLLNQTFTDFQIIISDNCSTDNTVETCRAFAEKDSRIRVVKQSDNLGIFGNFRFTLFQANSPYFMWACHDDRWAPEFIERNLRMLEEHPGAIGSVSKVRLLLPDGSVAAAKGTAPLRGEPWERVREFLKRPSEASRFYSVFRTADLKACFPEDIDVFGYDYVVLALAALRGEFLEVDDVLMEREAHDYIYYQQHFVARRPTPMKRWFAMRDLTAKIREKLSPPYGTGIRRALFMLQVRHAVQYAIYRFPPLADASKKIGRSARRPMVSRADNPPR
jgi:glycosyltransferase involved in cell wall biosynthesis